MSLNGTLPDTKEVSRMGRLLTLALVVLLMLGIATTGWANINQPDLKAAGYVETQVDFGVCPSDVEIARHGYNFEGHENLPYFEALAFNVVGQDTPFLTILYFGYVRGGGDTTTLTLDHEE